MPLKVYDETIRVLKSAVRTAKLGREEELGVLKRLDDQARILEQRASGLSVEGLITRELKESHAYEGRSIFGWETQIPNVRNIDVPAQQKYSRART